VSNKIEHLDVEFYRNYIGIENPLVVQSWDNSLDEKWDDVLELVKRDYIETDESTLFYCDNNEECGFKPHLKKPSDLTDDEWLFVWYGDNIPKNAKIKKDESFKFLIDVIEEVDSRFGLMSHIKTSINLSNGFVKNQRQEHLNRLYSLHSHPQAEELINNGLAIDAKESGVYDE